MAIRSFHDRSDITLIVAGVLQISGFAGKSEHTGLVLIDAFWICFFLYFSALFPSTTGSCCVSHKWELETLFGHRVGPDSCLSQYRMSFEVSASMCKRTSSTTLSY